MQTGHIALHRAAAYALATVLTLSCPGVLSAAEVGVLSVDYDLGQMAPSSGQSRRDSEAFSDVRDSPETGDVLAQLRRRRTPLARMTAISRRRWDGVISAGSSVNTGSPLSVAHNDLRFAASELSGGGESAMPSGCGVLLQYLPLVSSKCRVRGGSVFRKYRIFL